MEELSAFSFQSGVIAGDGGPCGQRPALSTDPGSLWAEPAQLGEEGPHEGAELLLDEAGHRVPAAARLREEALELLANRPVEEGLLRTVGGVERAHIRTGERALGGGDRLGGHCARACLRRSCLGSSVSRDRSKPEERWRDRWFTVSPLPGVHGRGGTSKPS